MASLRFPVSTPIHTLPHVKQPKLVSSISNPSSQCKANVSKILAAKVNLDVEGSNKETVAEKISPGDLQSELVMPKHVAVIMDGNRRWASQRGLSAEDAHRAGGKRIKDIALLCHEWGVKVLTVFAFSAENWSRPKEEVEFLMSLFEEQAQLGPEEVFGHGVQMTIIGDRSKLPKSLQRSLELGESKTKANKGLQIMIALNYSGRQDILQATRKIASKVKDGMMLLEDIDDELFGEELQTNCAEFPIPDLLIRTSGEKRVSNFMLWQLAYTELFFVDKFFPDFEESDFMEAISSFQRRQRRFGGYKY